MLNVLCMDLDRTARSCLILRSPDTKVVLMVEFIEGGAWATISTGASWTPYRIDCIHCIVEYFLSDHVGSSHGDIRWYFVRYSNQMGLGSSHGIVPRRNGSTSPN